MALVLAYTHNTLQEDSQYVFNFLNATEAAGQGGACYAL